MAIELMNLKGNITLGGEVSGQVELDNTITEEVRDILSSCKHIEIIKGTENNMTKDVIDLWELEPGIYYFDDGDGAGFEGDMTHGTGTDKVVFSSGSILIISSYMTSKYIEEHEDILYGNVKRSIFIVGNTSYSIGRIYTGALVWNSINGYKGSVNIVESAENRVSIIDSNIKAASYPTARAVVKYVEEALAALEVSGGGVGQATDATGAEIFNDYANNKATGNYSTASGYATKATANYASASGYFAEANGNMSRAEGYKTKANGSSSHAEGSASETTGSAAHAEGDQTKASGYASHSEGGFTEAQAGYSHAEGYKTIAKGNNSHTEGRFTIASGRAQQVLGKWNIEDTEINEETGFGKYIQIIGNGDEETETRSNAYTLDWDGNGVYAGTVQAADFLDAEGKPLIGQITLAKAEKVFIQDLEPGFYVVHAPEGGGIAGGKTIHGVKGDSHLMLSGDQTVAKADAAGITKFRKSYFLTYSVIGNSASSAFGIFEANKVDGAWSYTKISGGTFETTTNKVITINDTTTADNIKYPSAKAVKDYVASQLVPIELDVGSEHAENEYYNANAVDAVLIEVVGLLEGFEERISALESK